MTTKERRYCEFLKDYCLFIEEEVKPLPLEKFCKLFCLEEDKFKDSLPKHLGEYKLEI